MGAYRNAILYGYSNTRVRAMLSRMLSRASILDLSKAESTSTMIGSLLQTEYRQHLDHFV